MIFLPTKRSMKQHFIGWLALMSTLALYWVGAVAAAFWMAFILCAAVLFFYCIADDQYEEMKGIATRALETIEEDNKSRLARYLEQTVPDDERRIN